MSCNTAVPSRALRRALALFTTVALAVAALTVAGAAPASANGVDPTRCAPAHMSRAEALNWNNGYRDGYFAGADMTGATDLGDGRTVWLMGDTWVGGARGPGTFINNSLIVEHPNRCFTHVMGWNGASWTGLMPGTAHHFYWPLDAIVDGGRLHVFFSRFAHQPGTFLGGVQDAIVHAEIELNTWRVVATQLVAGAPNVEFGSSLLVRDGHVYIYGQRWAGGHTNSPEVVLARAPIGALSNHSTWTYWNGTDFGAGLGDARAVLGPVMRNAVSFNTDGATIVAVGQEGTFVNTRLAQYNAANPWGPFTRVASLGDIPNQIPPGQPASDGYVYHGGGTHISGGALIVGWSYNSFNQPPIAAGNPWYYGTQWRQIGAHTSANAVVSVAERPGGGFWTAASDGTVSAHDGAPHRGDMGGQRLNRPIVGIAATPSGGGYWLVASDGGIFSFGDAAFYGSTGAMRLNQPIVGMSATPTGGGYWLVASDGGIFSFGDAAFYGSTGAIRLNQPIVGMATTPTGRGYLLVASDGGIFTFGDGRFFGSTGGMRLNAPIVGMATTRTGNGYWLAASDGGIFTFGDAHFAGAGTPGQRTAGVVARPDGGYTLVDTTGGTQRR